jgi:hypothetical protein
MQVPEKGGAAGYFDEAVKAETHQRHASGQESGE